MTGSVRIDGATAEAIDQIIMNFIQENVLRGSVSVTTIGRGFLNRRVEGKDCAAPYYDVQFNGTLDELASLNNGTKTN